MEGSGHPIEVMANPAVYIKIAGCFGFSIMIPAVIYIYIRIFIYIYVYEYVLTDRSTVLVQRMILGLSPHLFVQGGWTMLHWAAKHGKKVRVELHPQVPWG